jgi:hypothetical protein
MSYSQRSVAIVGECKAKPLRDVSEHRGNVRKIESDVKKTIQGAYDQACSVIRLLRSKDVSEVICWSSDQHNKRILSSINTRDITDAILSWLAVQVESDGLIL